jgi:hypothetical protein
MLSVTLVRSLRFEGGVRAAVLGRVKVKSVATVDPAEQGGSAQAPSGAIKSFKIKAP